MKKLTGWITRSNELFLFIAYMAAISFLACYHEVWRDEVRAYSIIRSVDSPLQLLEALKNEGHPFVWYLALWFGDLFLNSPVVLKLVSLFAAGGAALLLVWSRSFSLWEKGLWLLGVLPLYEYSVLCRNYGVGMLFLFLFCRLSEGESRYRKLQGLALFLLANTSFFGFLLSSAIAVSEVLKFICFRIKNRPNVEFPLLLLCYATSGIAVAAFQMYPDQTTIVTEVHQSSFVNLVDQVVRSIYSQGGFALDAISLRYPISPTWFLIPLYFCFLRTPWILGFLLVSVCFIDFTHQAIYPVEALRHQGFIILSIIASLWMYRSYYKCEEAGKKRAVKIEERILPPLFAVILLFQIDSSFIRVETDLKKDMSAAPAVARLVSTVPEYHDAIIIAEPDYYAETLPYYLENRIYLVREKKFRNIVSFTQANQQILRMSDLVYAARELNKQYDVPILLLYGHRFQAPGEHTFSFEKEFHYDALELASFRVNFRLIDRFLEAVNDETYNVYEFKGLPDAQG